MEMLKEKKKVYVVTIKYEYDPDVVSIYAVVSTKERAKKTVARLYDELRAWDGVPTSVKFFEMTLDELPD